MGFPVGWDEVRAEYGDPRPYLRSDGMPTSAWETVTLGYLQLPQGLPLGWDPTTIVHRVRVHHKLLGALGEVLQEIYDKGYWGLLKSFDGSYNWRTQRGSVEHLSMHCWGVAIDLNASTNRLGTKGTMPPEIIHVFKKRDWEWGGIWHRPDPQHFQAAHGV